MSVPKLRFPGFDGEWEEKKIGSVVNSKSDKYNPVYDTANYKCIELEHLESETGHLLGYTESITAGSIKNVFKKGDVLFGKLRPYLRKYLRAPFDGVCSSEIWVLNSTAVSHDFLFQFIQTDRFINVANVSSGSKMPRADWTLVADSTISIPSLEEQKKIAGFLSAVDEKINLLSRKKSILENYKQGVMQKLFSQQLRFKANNGIDFPEWEEVTGDEIFRSISNKNHNSDLPVLAATQQNGIQRRDSIGIQIMSTKESISSYKIIDEGDFVISLRSFQGGIEYSSMRGICSPAYTILKPIVEIIPHFFRYYFKKESFINQLNNLTVGIRDGKQISYDAFCTLLLPFPCLKEQKKIANFLSSIDEKIELVGRQIEGMKLYKKGLLQQMFV